MTSYLQLFHENPGSGQTSVQCACTFDRHLFAFMCLQSLKILRHRGLDKEPCMFDTLHVGIHTVLARGLTCVQATWACSIFRPSQHRLHGACNCSQDCLHVDCMQSAVPATLPLMLQTLHQQKATCRLDPGRHTVATFHTLMLTMF